MKGRLRGQVLLPLQTFSLIMTLLCQCPGAAIANDQEPRDLKQQELFLSQFWGPEPKIKVSLRRALSGGSRESPCCPVRLWGSRGSWAVAVSL